MLKKNWEMPVTVVQKFEPNEYVAVCWGVSCSVDKANAVERGWMIELPNGGWQSNYANGQTHSSEHCGLTSNQWIVDSDNDGYADSMTEINTDKLGDLSCILYDDATYTNTIDISTVQSGSYIYWTTQASDGRVWHHQGLVSNTVPGHPNRS